MQRQRPVTEAGRTHAEWQQAVIGHGRRPGPEWRLCEGLRPLSSGESAQLAPPTASSSPGLTVSTLCRRSLRRPERRQRSELRSVALPRELTPTVTKLPFDVGILAVRPERFRITGKGKRTPLVDLRWRDLLSPDAAMAVALNASLSPKGQPPNTRVRIPNPIRASKPAPTKAQRK